MITIQNNSTVNWHIDILVHRRIGTLIHYLIGTLAYWHIETLLIMRNKLLLSAAILPICGIKGEAQAAEAQKHPNIIMFLADDMGWQDTSLPFWTQRTHYNDIY